VKSWGRPSGRASARRVWLAPAYVLLAALTFAVAAVLQPRRNITRQDRVGRNVEQNCARRTDQGPRPTHDHHRCDQAHRRIHPEPAELAPQHQTDDHQHRNRGIGHDVHESGAQIVIAMNAVVMGMMVIVSIVGIMSMPVMMLVVIAQQDGAEEINAKPEYRDRNGLVERNRHRIDQAIDAFVADQERDHGQHDGAGEGRQVAELAGPEGQAPVCRIAPRVGVGQRRDEKRAGMRRHMQPISHQRHRAKPQAASNLGHHHRGADRDDGPRFPFVSRVRRAEKNMRVTVALDRMRMHG